MMAEEYQREVAAFNTALPDPNVANSTADILLDKLAPRLPASGTISTATDVTAALSAKEKSLLGLGVFPGFREYFDTVADAADPSTTYWTVVQTTDLVYVQNNVNVVPGYLTCSVRAVADDDGLVFSRDKKIISLKYGVTTICLQGYIKFNWSNDAVPTCFAGLFDNDAAPASVNDMISANNVASIDVNEGVPYSRSGNSGGVDETTNLSAFISDDTWFLLKIEITSSSVKFYIDGTLRATHSTRVPAGVYQIGIGATSNGNINTVYAQYLEIWGE